MTLLSRAFIAPALFMALLFLFPIAAMAEAAAPETLAQKPVKADTPQNALMTIDDPERRQEFYRVTLEAFVKTYDLVGAVLLIDGPNGKILVSAGLADERTGEKMRTDHKFHIMSVTKMFTATAVMMLMEQGKISLDDFIADRLEETFDGRLANFEEAKIIHLLEHSSGMPDYLPLGFTRAMYDNPLKRWGPMDAITFAFDHPAHHPPGQQYRYTNTGWLLLGEMIKEIEGQSLQEVFDRLIFKPAGMKNTNFRRYPEPMLANAYMDLNFDGEPEELMDQQWGELADGSLVSTAEDLNAFLNALLVEKKLVSDKTLKLMMENNHDITETEYGRGLMVVDPFTSPKVGHMARYIGHGAFAMRYVERDTNIVFLTNSIDKLKNFREIEKQAAAILFGPMEKRPRFQPVGKAEEGTPTPESWHHYGMNGKDHDDSKDSQNIPELPAP